MSAERHAECAALGCRCNCWCAFCKPDLPPDERAALLARYLEPCPSFPGTWSQEWLTEETIGREQ